MTFGKFESHHQKHFCCVACFVRGDTHTVEAAMRDASTSTKEELSEYQDS
jgi:hypothetical protein